jgi:nucleoside 2-deoxyribosyltransferase
MQELKPPYQIETSKGKTIFLAGSIEMGKATHWQQKIVEAFSNTDLVFFNPRRDDWDSSWEQKVDNPPFFEQVNWELDHIEAADLVIFYFDPATQSPVTLMELGIVAKSGKPAIVCCPEGFWRKGNVDIVCKRYSCKQVDTLDDLIRSMSAFLKA